MVRQLSHIRCYALGINKWLLPFYCRTMWPQDSFLRGLLWTSQEDPYHQLNSIQMSRHSWAVHMVFGGLNGDCLDFQTYWIYSSLLSLLAVKDTNGIQKPCVHTNMASLTLKSINLANVHKSIHMDRSLHGLKLQFVCEINLNGITTLTDRGDCIDEI